MRSAGLWARTRRRLRALVTGDLGAGLFGRAPSASRVRWHGAGSEAQALEALVEWAGRHMAAAPVDQWVLSLGGEGDDFHNRLARRLTRRGIAHRRLSLEQALALPEASARQVAAVLCAALDARTQTRAAQAIAGHPILGARPFEHACGLDPSQATFKRLDEYPDTHFVSPVLLDAPTPYAIYEESLRHFEQKCGLRDFLDLYQLLRSVVANGVAGDIAEFGSYRGHSGYLIARSLEALGSDKRLYMFDTFDSFPEEAYGVDHFWSATHPVNFEQVRAKFAGRDNVTLVRGDFTQTLAETAVAELALAYIDCDSYRATRYLLQALPGDYLRRGGILVCEDYGHPALLGNRAAVHEIFDAKQGWFKYFSQFSGLYIAVKVD